MSHKKMRRAAQAHAQFLRCTEGPAWRKVYVRHRVYAEWLRAYASDPKRTVLYGTMLARWL